MEWWSDTDGVMDYWGGGAGQKDGKQNTVHRISEDGSDELRHGER
jgi:hypothetical protein